MTNICARKALTRTSRAREAAKTKRSQPSTQHVWCASFGTPRRIVQLIVIGHLRGRGSGSRYSASGTIHAAWKAFAARQIVQTSLRERRAEGDGARGEAGERRRRG